MPSSTTVHIQHIHTENLLMPNTTLVRITACPNDHMESRHQMDHQSTGHMSLEMTRLHRRKSEQSLKASMGVEPPEEVEKTTQEVRFKAKN